jgi:NAD(P)-dependent dehydrogenase (short-subunit alcohol dehydrogenase family)
MDLRGSIALVTGGAHRVGKAIAVALAHEGANLVIHYGSSAGAAQQTAAEIAELGVEAILAQADLSDPAQIEALFETVRGRFGRLDVLVNSAASFQKRPFDDISLADWEQVMAVNLRAPFLCTQHAARLMRGIERPAGESGLIVNIADLSGVYPWLGYAHHGVSKAGLIHLTKVTARELAPTIRVNAIVPGPILPPPGMAPDGEKWQRVSGIVPLERAGDPENIGQSVIFLARNDYITGAIIEVDGGEHLLGPANH